MAITESLVALSLLIIGKTGLWGITFLMALESMIAPVPSEAVMPFVGFLWFEGKFTWWQILISSTLGSLVGSLISYWLGARFGETAVRRFGKYLLLNEHHLEQTKHFFGHWGDKTVFVSRFIPIVRHLISIPAGVGQMNLKKFIIYTVVGAAAWNMFLAWVGYQLNSRWEEVRQYSEVLDIILIVAILSAVAYWIKKRLTTPSPTSNQLDQ